MNTAYAVISPTDAKYPEGLRAILPDTQLYSLGNLGLLGKRAVGICGSREASPEALDYAFKFGREAAQLGFVVVSGYARGIDRQSHKGALEAGGATIAVLPEGIDFFRLVRELKPMVDLNHNFLAISMFDPAASWTSWRAMERNKLIVGLSVGLFVVEARNRGGTIGAALECAHQKKPLWAIAYSKETPGREGNRMLIQEAALPLKSLRDLRRALQQASLEPVQEVKQLAFDLV